MEKTKTSRSRANSKAKRSAPDIQQTYKDYVLSEGSAPASVFIFCKSKGLKEGEFYERFGSLEAIEKSIWKNYIDSVLKQLVSDSNYAAFSAREKILSFCFSLTETLKTERSFVLVQLKNWKNPAIQPAFIRGFHNSFESWASGVIAEGKKSGEIAKRPFIDERYQHLLWLHLLFILQFWSHDESANFDQTDAAIEKSLNLGFDLIGKGILDNALDFGKFLYQNYKN